MSATRTGAHALPIGLYDPAERAREKGRQRRQDVRDVAEGRIAEVERRNRRLPDARPIPAWEIRPLLE